MRKFFSYGPVNKELHFYVSRSGLVDSIFLQLTGGGRSDDSGHFITVWAPRQCGKTWIMREVAEKIAGQESFEVALVSMQSGRTETEDEGILELFSIKLEEWFGRDFPRISSWKRLRDLFCAPFVEKPLVLVLDEFDCLREDFIDKFANEFRDIYISRQMESVKKTSPGATPKTCFLHALALVGVRSVLGVESAKGSPFNVQRSVHIPNLSPEEVRSMFGWYEKESGRRVEPEAVEKIYAETGGQPGLVSWLGELLTEGYEDYRPDPKSPITREIFDSVLSDAIDVLPNNNILNIIGKAGEERCKETVLELFKTRDVMPFRFDDPCIGFLYANGVIEREKKGDFKNTVRFSSPFVQKRLFNYFSREIFPTVDHLYDPMTDIGAVAGEGEIDIPAIMGLYQTYLDRNRDWLFKNAPRRKTDLRIFEAVFHFNLYMYLKSFFHDKGCEVFPEFPTGNGKVDIVVRRGKAVYALELKSFKDRSAYKQALAQAAQYAARLKTDRIFLILFIESIDDENRRALESPCKDPKTGTAVLPIFVEIGDVSGRT